MSDHKLFYTFFCLLLMAAAPASAQWQGSVATVDGRTVVQNPAQPMEEPLVITLEEVFSLGGWSEDPDQFFGVISDVAVDGQNDFYLLDSQLTEVKVFDASGNFLRTLGREGEGPGEFRMPIDLVDLPDGRLGVIQPFPSKMVILERDGTPVDDFPFRPTGEGFAGLNAAAPCGDGLALIYSVSSPGDGKFTRQVRLAQVAMDGTEKAVLRTADSSMDYSNSLCVERDWYHFERCWAAGPDGRVYTRDAFPDYAVQVHGPDGALEHVLTREWEPHARTAAERQRIEEDWARGLARWVPNPTFEIEEAWNPVESLHARPDGTLWVRTSRGMREPGEGVLTRFDAFDDQGRYLREVVVKGEMDPTRDGLFVVGEYLVVVTDLVSARQAMWGGGGEDDSAEAGEPEPMSVLCYRMVQGEMAAQAR